MSGNLSIIKNDDETEIKTNWFDRSATLVKSVIGVAPVVGPALAELITNLIPDQKLERVITFASILEYKLKDVEKQILEQKLKTQEMADLVEDGVLQASRALSEERKGYIASLLKNGLTKDDLTHLEKKTLLSLLNQVNDAQLIILKLESLPLHQQKEFRETHKGTLDYQRTRMGSGQQEIDKAAIQEQFRDHLTRLNLLRRRYNKPKKGELPDFDERTGALKSSGYEATPLGKLLLRYVDLIPDDAT